MLALLLLSCHSKLPDRLWLCTGTHAFLVCIVQATLWRAWSTCSSLWMQPLFKLLRVRLFFAPALCARVLLFIAVVAALAEARRGLSVTGAPPRPVRARQRFGDFDVVAALSILEPLSHSLQSCHGTFKVCLRVRMFHGGLFSGVTSTV